MSPLLRRPLAVPSLFSQGGERDDAVRIRERLSGSPVASRIESLAVAVGLSDEETILGRSSRALAGTALAVFVIALPLMKATQIVGGMSLSH